MATYSDMLTKFPNTTKPYLNAGFVTLLDVMGSDTVIEECARMSYGDGTRKISDTRNLIRYLMRHKHTSPFEMGVVRFHVKMPIFIARQFIRHRTFSLNELSARYSELPNDMYFPELERLQKQSTTNKQGSSDDLVENGEDCLDIISCANAEAYVDYEQLLAKGLTRELARGVLPLNTYTELVFKADLKNLMHFLALRRASKAQKEIQDLANAIYELIKETGLFDLTLEAFDDYIFHSVSLSKQERMILNEIIDNDDNLKILIAMRIKESDLLSEREKLEFLDKLDCVNICKMD